MSATDPMAGDSSIPALDLATVERQVQQTGAYSALEWLLESGVLPYPAYEQWRHGGVAFLEDAFQADASDWVGRLREGEAQARALGLVNDAQAYHDWRPGHGHRPLALSPDAGRSTLLAQRWVRSSDLRQLDLFLDGGASGVEYDLRGALAARNADDAERYYARLCRIAPSHPGLGDYEALVLYARHLEQLPLIPSEAALDEWEGLVQEIAPLARERLRGQARDYLAPAWRRLAEALSRNGFDPDQPDLHASYAQMQVPDWDAVMRSVREVPGHAEHPILLSRLAQALHQWQAPEAAMLAWARCCELAPQSSPADLVPEVAPRLHRRALEFEALDEPLDPDEFPAWLLFREPGLLHHLDRLDTPVPTGAAFLAMAEVLRSRVQGADEVAARKRLQQLSPALLRAYLTAK